VDEGGRGFDFDGLDRGKKRKKEKKKERKK